MAYVIQMMLLADDEANFQGNLLWLRDWAIWSEAIDRVGWRIMMQLRASATALRPVEEAPAQLFEPSEFVEAHAMLLEPLLFRWDAFVIPPSGAYFAFISHEETLYLITKSHDVFTTLRDRFEEGKWVPEEQRPPF